MEKREQLTVPSNSIKREAWIDILRGLAVFMVVLGHLYKGYYYHLVANPIKMPAFYFITGYVASIDKSLLHIVKRRALGLFIPMLVFSLFPIRILYYLLIRQETVATGNYLMGFVEGSINWFIYSFFVSTVLFVAIYKVVNGNHILLGIGGIVCFIIGIMTKNTSFMAIWSLNTAFTSILFMYMGYEIRIHHWKFVNNKWIVMISFTIYVLLIWFSKEEFFAKTINFHLCEYYNIPVCLILVISGLVFARYCLIIICATCSKRIILFLTSFGQNTIVVYLASSTFNTIVIKLFNRLFRTDRLNFFICFLGATVSCLLGYLLSVFCRKYFPILLGVSRKPGNK